MYEHCAWSRNMCNWGMPKHEIQNLQAGISKNRPIKDSKYL